MHGIRSLITSSTCSVPVMREIQVRTRTIFLHHVFLSTAGLLSKLSSIFCKSKWQSSFVSEEFNASTLVCGLTLGCGQLMIIEELKLLACTCKYSHAVAVHSMKCVFIHIDLPFFYARFVAEECGCA